MRSKGQGFRGNLQEVNGLQLPTKAGQTLLIMSSCPLDSDTDRHPVPWARTCVIQHDALLQVGFKGCSYMTRFNILKLGCKELFVGASLQF